MKQKLHRPYASAFEDARLQMVLIRDKSLRPATFVSLQLLIAQSVGAESAGHGGASASHHVDLTWPWINLTVYGTILFLILRKPVKEYFADRAQKLGSLVRDSVDTLCAAEARYTEAKERFKSLDQQEEKIRSMVEEDAQAEANALVQHASERVARILETARATVAAEERHAGEIIRRQLVQEVMAEATARITHELSPEKDRALRSHTLSSLSRLGQ